VADAYEIRSSYVGPSEGQVASTGHVGNTIDPSAERKPAEKPVVRLHASYTPALGDEHALYGIPEADLPPFIDTPPAAA
jgi:hypothetical protein